MAVNREELVECLNDLIETCRDGENGIPNGSRPCKGFWPDDVVQ